MKARPAQLCILAGLMLAMALTRFHHFLPVADASWALFFTGGFYLAATSRWTFPLLMLEAVAIDWLATQKLGVSNYCLTPAYAFLVPTHAVLWLGGRWLRRRATENLHGLAAFAGSVFVAVTLAYAISNASFYWLGGRVAQTSPAHFVERFFVYYRHFLTVPAVYLAIIAAIHLLARRAAASRRKALR